MSGYPNQPPPSYQTLYPQLYNPNNAPPQQQYSPPGYPPGQPGITPGQPAATCYPGINPTPTAPPYQYPGNYAPVTPMQSCGNSVEWISTTPSSAQYLSNRAVVAGYEGQDGSPLWVIRASFEADLIPGKLAVMHRAAYVAWGGAENSVQDIEVCCAPPEKVRWQETQDGKIPTNAIVAGNTWSGEPLYVGRAMEQGSLTPGKVHPSHKVLYIPYAGKEIPHKYYEIMCLV